MPRRLVILACALSVAGCGGRSASVTPPIAAPAKVPAKTAQVQFSVTVPRLSAGHARSPRYVSVATQSASIVVSPAGGTPGTPVVVNCTNVCSGQIAAAVGSDTFTINLFDAPSGGGNVLSTGSLTQTIAIDQTNTVNVTFNGVVKSLAVTLNPASVATGTASTVAVTASALDAAGNVIVGPGSFADANGNPLTIALTDSDTSGATKLSTTSLAAPAAGITLSYNGAAIANPTVAAAAPGVTPASKTLTLGASGCPAPGTNIDLYLANRTTGVSTYSLAASGNAAPLSVLPVTTAGLAVDPQGSIYDANYNGPGGSSIIEVYCSLATGGAKPQRTIVPPSGSFPSYLALDPNQNLYAAGLLGTVDVYAPGAGSAAPPSSSSTPTPATRSLSGLGFFPRQIGADASGSIYAGNGIGINVYGPSANGNAPVPARQITSLAANLIGPYAVAADAAGDAFVLYGSDFRANRCTFTNGAGTNICQAVGIYQSGSSGAPAHVLTFDSQRQLGAYAGFSYTGSTVALAADSSGTVYVLTNITSNSAPTQGVATTVAVYPPGNQDGNATPSRIITHNNNGGSATSIAVDGSGNIYFTNIVTNAGASVVVYGPGGTAPLRTFGNGSLTAPIGIAVGTDGTAYVAESNSGVVSVYAAGASGTQAAVRTLNVAATFPSAVVAGIAVDPSGALYVNPRVAGGSAPGVPLVATYAAGAGGSQAPVRTVIDRFVQLDVLSGLTADSLGNLYVVGNGSNTVYVYPTSSNGSVSAGRRLSYVGASTRGTADQISNTDCSVYCVGASAYVDSRGNLYVSSFVTNSVLIYAPGAATPSRSIIGPSTQLLAPQAVVVDASGTTFVVCLNGTFVFGPTANGDATPLRMLNAVGAPAIGPGS